MLKASLINHERKTNNWPAMANARVCRQSDNRRFNTIKVCFQEAPADETRGAQGHRPA